MTDAQPGRSGYIDPDYFLGGAMELDAARRRERDRASTSARRSGSTRSRRRPRPCCELATEHMVRAIEEITLNQGIDPRSAVLVGGGGAAGLNAVAIARRLGCRTGRDPGGRRRRSARPGALMSDLDRGLRRHVPYDEPELRLRTRSNARARRASTRGAGPSSTGRAEAAVSSAIEFSVEARYPHQIWELEVPLAVERFAGPDDVERLRQDFHAVHEEIFAISDPDSPIEIVAWRARVRCRLRDDRPDAITTGAGRSRRRGHLAACLLPRRRRRRRRRADARDDDARAPCWRARRSSSPRSRPSSSTPVRRRCGRRRRPADRPVGKRRSAGRGQKTRRPAPDVMTAFLRPDGKEKVSGAGRYTADLARTGLLHAKFRYADHTHARILRIDTSRASALPGVVAVLTHEDVPDILYGGLVRDRRLFAREKVRFEADIVAAVAARNTGDRRGSGSVDRGRLRGATGDLRLRAGDGAGRAPLIHESWAAYAGHETMGRDRNILGYSTIARGDVDAALADADAVVRGRYVADVSHGVPIEPRAILAEWAGDRVTIWSSTQVPFAARSGVAHTLQIPESAFGSSSRCSAAGSVRSATSTSRPTSQRSRARPAARCRWCSPAVRSSSPSTIGAKGRSSSSRRA